MQKFIKQTCGTCKWARFEQMSKHNPPRLLNKAGRCGWPMPKIVIAKSIETLMPYRSAIWPNDSNCPTWEAKP